MSELRRDSLTGRTVIIAPERRESLKLWRSRTSQRGDIEPCPFCEGQETSAGSELLAWRDHGRPANGPGWSVRVVPNRLPVLRVEDQYEQSVGTYRSLGGLGAHEVIIDSPRHGSDWETMSGEEIRRVLWAWRERMRDLRRDQRLRSFHVVKNVGVEAGATLTHAHSQLVALPFVPRQLEEELSGSRARHAQDGLCALCAMVADEIAAGQRIVAVDEMTVALAPFASRAPFETWILPRRHAAAFEEAGDDVLLACGERLAALLRCLHLILREPPYSVLLHSAPAGESSGDAYHWHLELIPRVTAVSGLAWDGGLHVNPMPPEEAARLLRCAETG